MQIIAESKMAMPYNFPSKDKYENLNCICRQYENMEHVYTCSLWNQNKEETTYNMIFTDNIIQHTKVYKRFKVNYEMREKTKNENESEMKEEQITPHEISSVLEFSNGNKLTN